MDDVHMKKWTVDGFLNEFMDVHGNMLDRSFLFILGAGASVTSGIPAGAVLAKTWLEDERIRQVGTNGPTLEEWATDKNLEIDGFELNRIAEFYPQVYDLCFCDDRARGYASLEKAMERATPDIGYSILAQVLAETRHKIVITTNFDNLVADALSLYTDKFPLVCGHESLAGFARTRLRRPLIAKIHRDLLLEPRNTPTETSRLPAEWAKSLQKILGEYTPVVIGYGGNDGSLMEFLEELPSESIPGGIFWCYRSKGREPSDRIQRLVARHKGRLVPILGFDELMVGLNDGMKWPPLADAMEKESSRRIQRYRERFERLLQQVRDAATGLSDDSNESAILKAIEETASRDESWWQWVLRADAESDLTKRREIYEAGIASLPNSPEIHSSYARFLHDLDKDYDEAEKRYLKALELDPDHVDAVLNYAVFLAEVRKNHVEAERLYRQALALTPEAVGNITNFSELLIHLDRLEEACDLLDKAVASIDQETPEQNATSLFLQSLVEEMQNVDPRNHLSRLRFLIDAGFERSSSRNFSMVLEKACSALGDEVAGFYRSLAAAILSQEAISALEQNPRWDAIVPVVPE